MSFLVLSSYSSVLVSDGRRVRSIALGLSDGFAFETRE